MRSTRRKNAICRSKPAVPERVPRRRRFLPPPAGRRQSCRGRVRYGLAGCSLRFHGLPWRTYVLALSQPGRSAIQRLVGSQRTMDGVGPGVVGGRDERRPDEADFQSEIKWKCAEVQVTAQRLLPGAGLLRPGPAPWLRSTRRPCNPNVSRGTVLFHKKRPPRRAALENYWRLL